MLRAVLVIASLAVGAIEAALGAPAAQLSM
jgi:hypothetical protein